MNAKKEKRAMDIGVGIPSGPGAMTPHPDFVGTGARSGTAVSSGKVKLLRERLYAVHLQYLLIDYDPRPSS